MHYIPILKGKDAEFRALASLEYDIRAGLTPLIDLMPIGEEIETDQWISSTAEQLATAWPISRPIFVDAPHLGALSASSGESALMQLVRLCNERNVNLVPVTGLERPDAYQEAIREILDERRAFGACLRLKDFESEFPMSGVDDLLEHLALQAESADLLLDFGAISPGSSGLLGGLMYSYLESIPNLERWRTVTVAATAILESMSGLEKNKITRIPRSEWKAWLSLRGRSMRRLPQFSDYGIQHPRLVKFDGRKMRVSIQLRYTADQQWLIARGAGKDHAKMHQVCALLIQQPEYTGPDFSWGDQWISDCAAGKKGPGNPGLWRRVGTSHHLAFVVRQLASLA